MSTKKTGRSSATRRDFLKTSSVATGAALASQLSLAPSVHAAGSDTIKVGLIGCGGRGRGAVDNVLHAARGVTIHAIGDVFNFQVNSAKNDLQGLANDDKVKELGNSVDIGSRAFAGLDAYKKVLDSGVNYVILATTPGFRPIHLQAAVSAGKNIFTEKPVGVDGPGIRKVLDAYEEAKKRGLHIVAGTQRRHQLGYIETLQRIHDGAIGDLVGGQFYWMQGILWHREPNEEQKKTDDMTTDVAKQIHNWYNYTWLCGDHIVEQHVHNLDVMNWAFRQHPDRATGMGFRTRTDPHYGHIYDFFAIDYEFPNGVHTLSMCRQISNCKDRIGERIVGTKGVCDAGAHTINGQRVVGRKRGKISTDPYVQEHTDLIESIRGGKQPLNELKQVAESTLTAIMGRMSAYDGREVTWEQALNSRENLMPENLTWDMKMPEPPVAVPGKTRII
jgi:predicted dehydrogenase